MRSLLSLRSIYILLLAFALPAQAAWEDGNIAAVFTPQAEIRSFDVAPDGMGGSLATYMDRETLPYRPWLSRLSRTGTELWGDGGVLAPFDLSTDGPNAPVAIAPDGVGGAYAAWLEWYGGTTVVRLDRYDATGAFVWTLSVDNAGSDPGETGVRLVAEPNVGVTIGLANPSTQRLHAYRVDLDGNLVWYGPINDFYTHNIAIRFPAAGDTEFDMRSDGQGGVLFAWFRYDPVEYQNSGLYFEQIGVQRVDDAGNVLWGSDGVTIWEKSTFWHVNAYHARVVDDGSGGAFVVTSGGMRAYGQHLDDAGNLLWPSTGILLSAASTSSPDIDTEPEIVSDGSGGMLLVHGTGLVRAQRIDGAGNLLWGNDGIDAFAPDAQYENFRSAAIDTDGFGGAVIGCHRWQDGAESLCGLRVDAFGNALWQDEHLYDKVGNDTIGEIRVVSDQQGGAHFYWERRFDSGDEHLYALGVDSQGQPPHPSMVSMYADAGEPGEVIPVLVAGDYLDDTYTYELERGGATIALTGITAFSPALVGGWLDLSGASIGGWDLRATNGGVERGRLEDAFGVGLRPGCAGVANVWHNTESQALGSRRKMDFDAAGNARFMSSTFFSPSGEYLIYGHAFTASGGGSGLMDTFSAPVRDLSYVVDAADRDRVAFVEGTSQETLHFRTYQGGVVPELSFTVGGGGFEYANPVLAIEPSGNLHGVVEAFAGGVTELQSFELSPSTVTNHSIGSGTNAREPDMVAVADGLALVFVRDSFLPGLRELCLQRFRGGWEPPVVLGIGLSITSPSIAWDGSNRLLVAGIVDNSPTQTAPTLATVLLENDVPEPVRLRPTDGPVYRVQVAGQGAGRFYMLTQETGQPMQMLLRAGDGRVFFPKRRLNSFDDSDWPFFAAEPEGSRVAAVWTAYGHPVYGTGLWSWFCETSTFTAAPPSVEIATQELRVSPNPFNPRTALSFELSRDQWVKLEIFDQRGRRVRMLQDGQLFAGPNSVEWDGRDDAGAEMASGVYFARMRAAVDEGAVQKLTLLK